MITQEPKDGDFIAYIEQLQKESAARLLGSGHATITQLQKKPGSDPNKDGSHFFAGRKPADLRSPAELRAALAQVVDPTSIGHLVGSVFWIMAGTGLALYWLLTSASFALLVAGIVVILWGVGRMRRAWQRISPRQNKHAQALITKVFTAPSKPK